MAIFVPFGVFIAYFAKRKDDPSLARGILIGGLALYVIAAATIAFPLVLVFKAADQGYDTPVYRSPGSLASEAPSGTISASASVSNTSQFDEPSGGEPGHMEYKPVSIKPYQALDAGLVKQLLTTLYQGMCTNNDFLLRHFYADPDSNSEYQQRIQELETDPPDSPECFIEQSVDPARLLPHSARFTMVTSSTASVRFLMQGAFTPSANHLELTKVGPWWLVASTKIT